MDDVHGGAASGDPGVLTFEAFYADQLQSVARAVALAFGNLDLAQQATDEAFVRALEAWPRVSRMASPAGWTFRVALNCAKRMAQKESRRRQVESTLLPAEAFENHPDLHAFHECVAGLPERQRVAVILRFVADMTEADIAQAMGVRRGTVSATLRSAMRTLQPELQPDTDAGARHLGVNHA